MRMTFLLGRILAFTTVVYLLFVWLDLGRIDVSSLVALGATLALVAGVSRRPRQDKVRWLLPIAIVIYALGMLAALTLHLRSGLPASERAMLAALLIFGLVLSLRSVYQATRPVRRGFVNYYDRPTHARSRR